MLFQVKVRVNLAKMAVFGQKLQKGELDRKVVSGEKLIALKTILPLDSASGKLTTKMHLMLNSFLCVTTMTR
jgi:hypothetical protein